MIALMTVALSHAAKTTAAVATASQVAQEIAQLTAAKTNCKY